MVLLSMRSAVELSPAYEDFRRSTADVWNAENPKESEAAFRQLLETEQASSAPRSLIVAYLLTSLARAQTFQKNVAGAATSLADAETFLQSSGTSPISLKVHWLIERGRLYIADKTPSQARIAFSEAWSLAVPAGEEDAAVEISQLMAEIESPKEQLAWIVRAIEIAKASKDDRARGRLSSLHLALGWKKYGLRQFEGAIESFKAAVSEIEGEPTRKELFLSEWAIGKTLRAMNRVDEALLLQKGLLEKMELQGERSGRIYEELAECLHTLKRTDEARQYFEQAYHEFSAEAAIKDNDPQRMKRLKEYGKVK